MMWVLELESLQRSQELGGRHPHAQYVHERLTSCSPQYTSKNNPSVTSQLNTKKQVNKCPPHSARS